MALYSALGVSPSIGDLSTSHSKMFHLFRVRHKRKGKTKQAFEYLRQFCEDILYFLYRYRYEGAGTGPISQNVNKYTSQAFSFRETTPFGS